MRWKKAQTRYANHGLPFFQFDYTLIEAIRSIADLRYHLWVASIKWKALHVICVVKTDATVFLRQLNISNHI